MDKTRAMPILASAVVALSLTACQGMGGKEPQQTSSAQPSSAQTSSGQPTSQASQQAASPDMMRDVQRSLGAKGYNAGTPDGVYGASTEQALRKFQRDQKLSATGQLDTQTLAALGLTGGTASSRSSSYTPTSQRQGAMATPSHLSSNQVRSIQQNLTDRGYDSGRPDGVWGPNTQQALRSFERDQNLQADGRPDPQTLAALGVESGSPATQTGQMPEERRPLPPTGSAPEIEREPVYPPSETPDTRALPPEQQVPPAAEPVR